MARIGPKSIRGRVTFMAGVATAVAMVLIVVAMGLATRTILENAIADSLRERLDQACEAVAVGDYDLVIDLAGNEVVQVIDSKGNVVAGSRNARGLAAIDDGEDDEGETEVDDLEFERDEPGSPADEPAPDSTGSYAEPSVAPASSGDNSANTSGDSDGDDDTDVDDDADDAAEADDDDRDYGRGGNDDDDDDDDDDDAKTVRKASLGQVEPSDQGGQGLLSRNLAWADEPDGAPADPSASIDAASVLGSEGPYLILKDQVDSPDGPMTIVAITSLAQATLSAAQMMWLLAAIMAAVLVAVIALTWVLTGRTLRPVEQMRAEAASITAENLSKRIDVPRKDKDLAPLAETLNEMLDRIERLLEDEKRFISDASHELKSPIAAVSVILDSMRTHPDESDIPKAIEDLANENARMASIVGDMLALTRYDEGRLNCTPELIDVMDIVLEEAMALNVRSGMEVDVSDVQPLTCRADAGLLSHALRNLLDNAARYAEALVKVTCKPGEDGSVVILVSDDGPGIAPEDRERAFARFVCLDERSGTGLGLAVARAIAESNGGTLMFTDPELSGATAQLTCQGS